MDLSASSPTLQLNVNESHSVLECIVISSNQEGRHKLLWVGFKTLNQATKTSPSISRETIRQPERPHHQVLKGLNTLSPRIQHREGQSRGKFIKPPTDA